MTRSSSLVNKDVFDLDLRLSVSGMALSVAIFPADIDLVAGTFCGGGCVELADVEDCDVESLSTCCTTSLLTRVGTGVLLPECFREGNAIGMCSFAFGGEGGSSISNTSKSENWPVTLTSGVGMSTGWVSDVTLLGVIV